MTGPSRADAEALDRADVLAAFRDRVVVADPDLLYMDGNSLGRLPKATPERLRRVAEEEWGRGLVGAWDGWIDIPLTIGDLLGETMLGAAAGQVAVCDSTSVNFYKLAVAALGARPDRRVIVTDRDNFPTDRYLLESIAARTGAEIRWIQGDPVEGPSVADVVATLDERVALVTLSHVAYRSGALADMRGVSAAAHDAGALALWDLSHAVGAVPVDLDGDGADLAVGCTYKYLNSGPGGPAFLYVRRDLQERLDQPLWGWMGQHDQFEMGPRYEPAAGIRRFLVGTPPILSMVAAEEGIRLAAEAGIERLRAKGMAMTAYLVDLADAWLAPLGFSLATPRDPARRGSHVGLRHADAWRICRAAIERARVVPDFRTPDVIRIGPAPLYTRFTEVHDAMERIRDLVASGESDATDATRARVT